MKAYEAAALVGYSDWHYFCSLYRKTFGHFLSREKSEVNPKEKRRVRTQAGKKQ